MTQQSNSYTRLPIAENQARFRELVEQALRHARSVGASDAAAEVSESSGLSVSVRNDDIETVEQTRDRSLDVTVFAGQRRGSASTPPAGRAPSAGRHGTSSARGAIARASSTTVAARCA